MFNGLRRKNIPCAHLFPYEYLTDMSVLVDTQLPETQKPETKLTSVTDELNVRMQAKISSCVVVLKLYILKSLTTIAGLIAPADLN